MFPESNEEMLKQSKAVLVAQERLLGGLEAEYGIVKDAIVAGNLSQFDGQSILGHLNAAIHGLHVAIVRATMEVVTYSKKIGQQQAKPKPEPASPPPPAPKPEPAGINDGDEEVVDEPQPADYAETAEHLPPPSPPPAPTTTNGKAAKTPGHIEKLVEDIKNELAKFADWAHYADIFVKAGVPDTHVLAGKVTDVRVLVNILTALKAKPATKL